MQTVSRVFEWVLGLVGWIAKVRRTLWDYLGDNLVASYELAPLEPRKLLSGASISGVVFGDLDESGALDGAEVGLSGITIDLIDDLNDNGVLDSGETPLMSTVTSGGSYAFSGLTGGESYLVRAGGQLGYEPGIFPVALAVGESHVKDLPLTNPAPTLAGASFIRPEDAALGTVLGAVAPSDAFGDTVTVNITGGNEAGIFTIDQNTGELSLQGGLNYELAATHSLTLTATDLAENQTNATVTVTVVNVITDHTGLGGLLFNDVDNDGVQDAGESDLVGVTVELIEDLNGNGVIDPDETPVQTVTDVNGYQFIDVEGGLTYVEDYHWDGTNPGDQFGIDVGWVGDLNSDGFDDVAISSIGSATGTQIRSGFDGQLLFTLPKSSRVDGIGDINNDGIGDILIGTSDDDTNGTDSGMARVISGDDGSILYTFTGDDPHDRLGRSVAGMGDINADNTNDFAIGSSGDNGVGSITIYSGANGTPIRTIHGEPTADTFAYSADNAGDLNGDNINDLIVGDLGENDVGSARVYSGFDGALLHTWFGDSEGDWFGYSVSAAGYVDGDNIPDVVVGSRLDDPNGVDSGSATVFSGDPLTGSIGGPEIHKFEGANAIDRFGVTVSGLGDINHDGRDDVLIGAYLDDNNGPNSGSSTAFSGADGVTLYQFNGAAEQRFGHAVSDAGDLNGDGMPDFIAGANLNDTAGTDAGSATVYLSQPVAKPYLVRVVGQTGYGPNPLPVGVAMGQSATLDFALHNPAPTLIGRDFTLRENAEVGTLLGVVAPSDIYDDTVTVAITGGNQDNVFAIDPTTGELTLESALNFDVASVHSLTLTAIDSAGNQATATVTVDVINVLTNDTRIDGYLFNDANNNGVRDAGESSVVNATVELIEDLNGNGIIDPDEEVVETITSDSSDGSYAFTDVPGGVTYVEGHNWPGASAGDQFGTSVSGVGDVNGDGYDDIIIAVADTGTSSQTQVISGFDGSSIYGTWNTGEWMSGAVSALGDVNRDGVADFIIGSDLDDTAAINAGAVRVISGADGSIIHELFGDAANDNFGNAVDGIGDINGDDVSDFIIGIRGDNNGDGSVQIRSGRNASELVTIPGVATDGAFGGSVSAAGDVNNDGTPDVIVGAYREDHGGIADAGSARVYSGSSANNYEILHTFHGDSQGDWFGFSVSGAGDVNADGYDDVIVGARLDDPNGNESGSATIYSGSDGAILHTFTGSDPGDRFGVSVSGVGDLNNDGHDDVIVGAYLDDNNGVSSGSVTAFSRAADGQVQVLYEFNGVANELLGHAVSDAGDVNADGMPDFIAGGDLGDNHGTDAGSATVFVSEPAAKPYLIRVNQTGYAPKLQAVSLELGEKLIDIAVALEPMPVSLHVHTDPTNDHIYEYFSANAITWDDAKAFAESLTQTVNGTTWTGRLATVTSEAKHNVLVANQPTTNPSQYWLGGTQVREGFHNFEWTNGEPLIYGSWDPQSPPAAFDPTNPHAILMDEFGAMGSAAQTDGATGFIVEFAPSVDPAGPNLVVTDIAVNGYTTDLVPGDTLEIYVKVSNTGALASSATTVDLVLHSVQGAAYTLGTIPLSAIPPVSQDPTNGTVVVSASVTLPVHDQYFDTQNYRLTAVVDASGVVIESDETDNAGLDTFSGDPSQASYQGSQPLDLGDASQLRLSVFEDPSTGSYYEWVLAYPGTGHSQSYADAQALASTFEHEGRQGRLATLATEAEWLNAASNLPSWSEHQVTNWWVGGHRPTFTDGAPGDGWEWTTGEPWDLNAWTGLTTNPWATGTLPNDAGSDSLVMDRDGNPQSLADLATAGLLGGTPGMLIEYEPELSFYGDSEAPEYNGLPHNGYSLYLYDDGLRPSTNFVWEISIDGVLHSTVPASETYVILTEFVEGPSTHTIDVQGRFTDTNRVIPAGSTLTVNVLNEAPTATFTPPSVNPQEGMLATFMITGIADSPNDTDDLIDGLFTVAFDFDGDGVEDQTFPSTTTAGVTTDHRYADSGIYQAYAYVTDRDNDLRILTQEIVVDDVAPTATATIGNPPSPFEPVELTLAFEDPGDDLIQLITVDWGDGRIERMYVGDTVDQSRTFNPVSLRYESSITLSHQYTEVGPYDIAIDIADKDGRSGVNYNEITVPIVVAEPPIQIAPQLIHDSILSGGVATVVLQDTQGQLNEDALGLTWTIDWGDGTVVTVPPSGDTPAAHHQYDPIVTPAGTHNITVHATDSGGTPTATTTLTLNVVTPAYVPAAPENLIVTPGASSISLTWEDKSDNEDGFILERSSDGGVTYPVVDEIILGPGVESHTDLNTNSGVEYAYRLRAFTNDSGSTTDSDVLQSSVVTIDSTLPAPTNLTFHAQTIRPSLASQYFSLTPQELAWDIDPAYHGNPDITVFIEYFDDIRDSWNGLATHGYYDPYVYHDDFGFIFESFYTDSFGGLAQHYLSDIKDLRLRVRLGNFATGEQSPPSNEVIYTKTTQISQPAISNISQLPDGRIEVDWEPVSGADLYNVYYTTNELHSSWALGTYRQDDGDPATPDPDPITIGVLDSWITPAPGTEIFVAVGAFDFDLTPVNGYWEQSSLIEHTSWVVGNSLTPDDPENLAFTSDSIDGGVLTWDHPDPNETFTVYRSSNGGDTWRPVGNTGTNRSITKSSMSP